MCGHVHVHVYMYIHVVDSVVDCTCYTLYMYFHIYIQCTRTCMCTLYMSFVHTVYSLFFSEESIFVVFVLVLQVQKP